MQLFFVWWFRCVWAPFCWDVIIGGLLLKGLGLQHSTSVAEQSGTFSHIFSLMMDQQQHWCIVPRSRHSQSNLNHALISTPSQRSIGYYRPGARWKENNIAAASEKAAAVESFDNTSCSAGDCHSSAAATPSFCLLSLAQQEDEMIRLLLSRTMRIWIMINLYHYYWVYFPPNKRRRPTLVVGLCVVKSRKMSPYSRSNDCSKWPLQVSKDPVALAIALPLLSHLHKSSGLIAYCSIALSSAL